MATTTAPTSAAAPEDSAAANDFTPLATRLAQGVEESSSYATGPSCQAPPTSARADRPLVAAVEAAGDDHPLDLVGAFEDLHDLRLAHVALDGEVLRVARAAQHLDCVGGHAHRVVGRDELGDRRLAAEGKAVVAEVRRVLQRRPGR